MKIWRSGKDFLVERDRGFWLVDEGGAITQRFEHSDWNIEDEAGRTEFSVVDNELCKDVSSEQWGRGRRTERKTVLAGLTVDRDPETQRFIATVLGDERVSREEARLRRERAGEARISAIAGARRDHGQGEHFARAQHALCEHIRSSDDELYSALLRTLVELARAKANRDAISNYVRACLLACFAHQIPTHVPAGAPNAAPTLAAALLERARELEQRADGQEWVDAHNTARQYRLAAEAARQAAQALS